MTKDEILQKLQFDTKLRGLSKNTQDEYYFKVKHFQNYYDKPATELTVDDIKNYLYYLLNEKGYSPGVTCQIIFTLPYQDKIGQKPILN